MSIEDLKARVASSKEVAVGGPVMDCVKTSPIKVSIAELETAVEGNNNKDCPICKIFRMVIAKTNGGSVFVDKVDLEAVLESKSVNIRTTMVDGRKIFSKELAATKPSTKESKPDPSTKESKPTKKN